MGSRGRIVLPLMVRAALGVRPGDEVVVRVKGGRAALRRARDPKEVLEELIGDLTFTRELRSEAEREVLKAVENESRGDGICSGA